MARNPLIQRYLDAGMAFTDMTRSRAEGIVKELVKTGEVQAQKGEELVNQLVDRSRRNTDRLLEAVRSEVRDQVAALGLATKDDLARLEEKIDRAGAARKTTARKKKAPRKAAAKKSAATEKSS